jgi:hypothetical protein
MRKAKVSEATVQRSTDSPGRAVEDEYIEAREAAKMLGVSLQTLYAPNRFLAPGAAATGSPISKESREERTSPVR